MESVISKSVMIISAFGRGQWMAVDLARRGFNCKLVDISESLGRWSPEEGEGPFGYVASEHLTSSMQERLVADDLPEPTGQGFTLWLKSGPVELKSPLTKYRLAQLQQDERLIEILAERNSTQLKAQELQALPFSQRWLLSVANDFSSTTYRPAEQSYLHADPEKLLNTYHLRHPSRPGYDRSLQWVRDQGVEVLAGARVTDLAINHKNVDGFELSYGRSQLVKAEQFVWMLTSEETEFIAKSVFKKIFADKKVAPTWSWVRFRVRFKDCRERDVLPICFLVIEDLEFPWTHENYIFVKKTPSRDLFDVWIRVPTTQRFLKQYLEDMGVRLVEKIKAKAERLDPVIVDYPQEYNYTYDDLGPSRVPIYLPEKLNSLRPAQLKNLYLDGPEQWSRQDWESQLLSQLGIVKKIQGWWDVKVNELKKHKEVAP